MIVDKYLHTGRRVKGVVIYAMVTTLPFIPCGHLPALHWRNHEPPTYIDCPDKMKLAFGIATVNI